MKMVCFVVEVEDNNAEEVINKVKNALDAYSNLNVAENKSSVNWETKLRNILNTLGISTNYMGYNYIIDMMKVVSTSDKLKRHICLKEIYDEVCGKGADWSNVERAVRTVIGAIWRNNYTAKISKVLGVEVSEEKPTIIKFVGLLSEILFK